MTKLNFGEKILWLTTIVIFGLFLATAMPAWSGNAANAGDWNGNTWEKPGEDNHQYDDWNIPAEPYDSAGNPIDPTGGFPIDEEYSFISGIVVDEQRNPVKGVSISAMPGDGTVIVFGGWDETDEYGRFEISVSEGHVFNLYAAYVDPNTAQTGGYFKDRDGGNGANPGNDGRWAGKLTLDWAAATGIEAVSGGVDGVAIVVRSSSMISGRVVDESGNPVAGIWVDAMTGPPNIDPANPDGMPGTIGMVESLWFGGETDQNGNYAITVWPSDGYRVGILGYGGFRTVFYENAATWEDATPVNADNGPVTGIDLTVTTGPGISGVLYGLKKGETAYIDAWSESTWSWGSTTVTGANSDNTFKIRGLEDASDYKISVWADGYVSGYVDENGKPGPYENAAEFATGNTDVRIYLDKGKTISGELKGLTAGVVAWVDTWSESTGTGDFVEVSTQDGKARFELSGLAAADDYRIHVHAEGYVSGYYAGDNMEPVRWEDALLVSTANGNVSGISIAMTTGHTIGGKVTGLGEGDQAFVSAWTEIHGWFGETRVRGTGSAGVSYEIGGLGAADDYLVMIVADGYVGGFYGGNAGLTDREDAVLVDASKNPADIDLALSRGQTISGTITGLEAGEVAYIEAFRGNSDSYFHMAYADGCGGVYFDSEPEPVIDPDGNVIDETDGDMDGELENIDGENIPVDCPGFGWNTGDYGFARVIGTAGAEVRYEISGLRAADDFIVVFRPDNHAPDAKTDVDTSSEPDDVDFAVSQPKTVSGTIYNAEPGEWIWINATSRELPLTGYASVQADENGIAEYEITGLGGFSDYVIQAGAANKNLYYNQKTSFNDADDVDLSNGSATGIDFDFSAIEMATLSGMLTGLEEDSVVWIDAWDENNGAWGNTMLTGNGAFTLSLPEGEYMVAFHVMEYGALYYDVESGTPVENWDEAEPLKLDGDFDMGTLEMP